MVIPYNEEEARFNRMTKHRAVYLLNWMISENNKRNKKLSTDALFAKFYGSKTFEALMDANTNLYCATEAALVSLLKSEFEGDMVEWQRHSMLLR